MLADARTFPVDAPPGTAVEVLVRNDRAQVVRTLAEADTGLAVSYGLALAHGLDPLHPAAVLAETQSWKEQPGFDDPGLVDWRGLPFVTIDGPGTRDLDQALAIEKTGTDYVVRYALADAAHFVRPGSALFDEGLRRGASYYLPGLSIPMLPRALSEGLVSLNPGVDRRATVFEMHLGPDGRCRQTRIVRALIHSRAQLTFARVQAWLDEPKRLPLEDREVGISLRLLREVGELRLEDAAEREVAFYRRAEVEFKLGGSDALGYSVVSGMRNSVELYSEQLSLMCNVEGARYLRAGDRPDDHVHPVYRVHAPPRADRIEGLERMLESLASTGGLDPKTWAWNRGSGVSLSRFLADLPRDPQTGRLADAIERQAIMVNVRSQFSTEAAGHHGVGADVYARFSAPMREIVGVFLHKEAWEKMSGSASAGDEALREQIVERANQAKSKQRELTRAANLFVLDELFGRDLERTRDQRLWRRGTVMGLTRSKLHVRLDDPPVDVKLYARHVPGGWTLDRAGAWVACEDRVYRLGDAVDLRTEERDGEGRWRLDLGPTAPAR